MPFALFVSAISVLVLSLARPELNVSLPVRSSDVVLAFDTSNSMQADDVAPTRLEVARAVARELLSDRPRQTRIAIVAFTDGGTVLQPLTGTPLKVDQALDRLQATGGTSLGEGIFAALGALTEEPIAMIDGTIPDLGDLSNTAIVLFTDGENTGGSDPVQMAALAADAGVRIYAVGVGTARGTVMTLDEFSIATSLDEERLTDVAEASGGRYFAAAEDPELGLIFGELERRFERQAERIEVTALAAMATIVLLMVACGLSLRWFGRVI